MVGNYLYRRIATLDTIQSRRRGPGCEYLVITVNNIHKDPQQLVQLPTKGHLAPAGLSPTLILPSFTSDNPSV